MYWKETQELKPPAQWWGGTVAGQPTGTYGLVLAVDLTTGRVAWQTKLPKPQIGGLLATAGGLVFSGSSDKHFLAFDARTGHEVWRWPTDAAINAPPITYEVDGVQYVAVAATGIATLNTPRGDEMLAFALPHNGPAGAGLPGVLTPQRDSLTVGATLRASPDAATRKAAPPSGKDTTPRAGGQRPRRPVAPDTRGGPR
jgi:outer membrane protein assembly factor BamB